MRILCVPDESLGPTVRSVCEQRPGLRHCFSIRSGAGAHQTPVAANFCHSIKNDGRNAATATQVHTVVVPFAVFANSGPKRRDAVLAK